MQLLTTDVVVIGAGTAGLNAVREIEQAGRRWLLIENGAYGTTCARVGCMPSKLLIAAADGAHAVRMSAEFGIAVAAPVVDAAAVFARLRRERDRFVAGAVRGTEKLSADRRVRGTARFVAPTRVRVDDNLQIDARAVVIATGSTPNVPSPFAAVRDLILTSDDLFELDELPATLAVIGTGAIGLELGQALGRLGVAVTFFSSSATIGPLKDPEMQTAINASFRRAHTFHLGVEIVTVQKSAGGLTVGWRSTEGEHRSAEFGAVLVAAGRKPNLGKLNLAATGLALDDRGRPAWNATTTQCGDAPIFLAGDASGHRAILHEAADEGSIAGANAAAFPAVRPRARRAPLAIVFSSPQIASLGEQFSKLDAAAIAIGEVSFENQGRARVQNTNEGKMRLYADRSCSRLLGAELFGPEIEHVAHLLAWAVQNEMTVPELLRMPFYHPVIEEGVRTALRQLARQLQVERDCQREDFASAPGT